MESESLVVIIHNSMALLKSAPTGSLTTYGISEQCDKHMFCLSVYHNGDEHDVECSVDDEDLCKFMNRGQMGCQSANSIDT